MPSFSHETTKPQPKVSVLGVPLDENSSYLRGAAEAPARIRENLYCGSANLCTESGLDLTDHLTVHDAGDLVFTPGTPPMPQIEEAVTKLLAEQNKVLTLGGDHSITYPIIQAYSRFYDGLTILHIDAHPDLYDDFEGNPYSHASPFARIMEESLVKRLVQIGIRTLNPHQREQAHRFGVEIIEMRHWRSDLDLGLTGPLYLTLDMDGIDPAYAPGVSHHEPGGFSSREILTIIQNLKVELVGADLVEFNPTRDPSGITAMLAAKLYKELVGKLLD
jgi:arginase